MRPGKPGRTAFFLVLLSFFSAVLPGRAAEKIYTVAGSSMLPTLRPGDKITVKTADFLPLRRNDLAAIQLKNRENPMVKRVIAVAGDRLSIVNNRLQVNGSGLQPELIVDSRRWRSTINQLRNYNWIIPANTVFVLGDNRRNSRDSRRLGLISLSQISGKIIKR